MLRSKALAHPALARFALLLGLAAGCVGHAASSSALDFNRFVIIGDSLSDTGNDADLAEDSYGVRVPGTQFNYTDGRFTSGKDTDPASALYGGVWHEQLAKIFLGLPAATASLDGGFDYAYGGATTEEGQTELDFTDGIGIKVDNMSRQVSNYLARETPDAATLYIVWGGANDLFNNTTDLNALGAADRESLIVQRLGEAGARIFLVPNLPPLGATPDYNTHPTQAAAITQYASDFRDRLNADLDGVVANLAAEGITVQIYRLDVFDLFGRLLKNKAAYGFTDILQSSQGSDLNPDKSLFWDGVHPTAAGHFQLAAEAYTLLTGQPVVQAFPKPTQDGFYLTRSGTDVSSTFNVAYTVKGKAVAGVDYAPLKGFRKIKAGKQTQAINVGITAAGAAGAEKSLSITLAGNNGEYAIPPVSKAKIKIGPTSGLPQAQANEDLPDVRGLRSAGAASGIKFTHLGDR